MHNLNRVRASFFLRTCSGWC